jgi:hypothetical protein
MNGTTKQIEWAEKLRSEKMNDLRIKCENMIQSNQSAQVDQIEKIKNQLELGLNAMSNQNDAKWWIEEAQSMTSGQIVKILLNK